MLSQYLMEMLLQFLVLITICNNVVDSSTTNNAAAGNNGKDN